MSGKPPPRRIWALDVGTQTIGMARADLLGIQAFPVTTLSRRGVQKDVEALIQVFGREGEMVEQVVVGLPYELDGSEGRSARLARQVGEALSLRGLNIVYMDERYSSVEADRGLIAQGLSREKRKTRIDQAAACVILERYLHHPELQEPSTP